MIFGKHRSISYGSVDTPHWGEQFMYAGRTGWLATPRRSYAEKQIQTLAMHIGTLQIE